MNKNNCGLRFGITTVCSGCFLANNSKYALILHEVLPFKFRLI